MKDIFTQKFNEALNISGISQTVLADKIGVHKQCISDYKSGKSFPSLPTLRLIAITLEVSSDFLLGLGEL